MGEDKEPATSTEIARGATLTTAYASREVKVLAVLDTEVQQISMFNTLATAFVSAGTASVSIAIGIWVNGAFAERLTPEGTVLSRFGAPALFIVGLFFYLLASWIYRTRKSTLDMIRTESKPKIGP
jgi:hypothetical protein